MDLKELARKKGTNIKKIAEKCGIPPTTLYAISRGDTNFGNVGIDTAIKVAGCLGMTVEELYTGRPSVTYAVVEVDKTDEGELLGLYRAMSAEGKSRLMEQAAFLAERHPLNQASEMVS